MGAISTMLGIGIMFSFIDRASRAMTTAQNSAAALFNTLKEGGIQAMVARGKFVAAMAGLIAGAGLVSAAISGISGFAEMDVSLTRMAISSQATNEQLELMRERVYQLGLTTIFTTQDIAEAAHQISKAGVQIENVYEILGSVTQFATASAGLLNVAESGEIATMIMKGYNITAAQLPMALDAVTRATQLTRLGFEDINYALGNAAKMAQGANQSFYTMLTTVSMLKDIVPSAAMAGTDFRMALQQMFMEINKVSKSSKMAAMARGIGLEVVDPATGKIRDFIDILMDLQNTMKTRGGGFEKIRKEMSQLFQVRSIHVFNMLLSRTEERIINGRKVIMSAAELMKYYRDQIMDSVGATKEASEKTEATLKFTWLRLQQAMMNVMTAIGEGAATVIVPVLSLLYKVVSAIASVFAGSRFLRITTGVSLLVGGMSLFAGTLFLVARTMFNHFMPMMLIAYSQMFKFDAVLAVGVSNWAGLGMVVRDVVPRIGLLISTYFTKTIASMAVLNGLLTFQAGAWRALGASILFAVKSLWLVILLPLAKVIFLTTVALIGFSIAALHYGTAVAFAAVKTFIFTSAFSAGAKTFALGAVIMLKSLLPLVAILGVVYLAVKAFQFAYKHDIGGLKTLLSPMIEAWQLFNYWVLNGGVLTGEMITGLSEKTIYWFNKLLRVYNWLNENAYQIQFHLLYMFELLKNLAGAAGVFGGVMIMGLMGTWAILKSIAYGISWTVATIMNAYDRVKSGITGEQYLPITPEMRGKEWAEIEDLLFEIGRVRDLTKTSWSLLGTESLIATGAALPSPEEKAAMIEKAAAPSGLSARDIIDMRMVDAINILNDMYRMKGIEPGERIMRIQNVLTLDKKIVYDVVTEYMTEQAKKEITPVSMPWATQEG